MTINLWNLKTKLSITKYTIRKEGNTIDKKIKEERVNHLDTLELRNIGALLLGEAATLSVGSLRALSSWNSLALFLLNSLTLPLLDIVTLLLGHVLALLGSNITALLLVMNLLADLFGNWVAFLAINGLTLTTRYIL